MPVQHLFGSVLDTSTATTFCAESSAGVSSNMPTEVSIPDAEDLKSRVRELRRFL
jgi:hypothetical protein